MPAGFFLEWRNRYLTLFLLFYLFGSILMVRKFVNICEMRPKWYKTKRLLLCSSSTGWAMCSSSVPLRSISLNKPQQINLTPNHLLLHFHSGEAWQFSPPAVDLHRYLKITHLYNQEHMVAWASPTQVTPVFWGELRYPPPLAPCSQKGRFQGGALQS